MSFSFTSLQRRWGAIVAIQAFIAVAAGAFGAHGLKHMVPPQNIEWWQTACQYLMYHSLAGLFVVMAASWRPSFLQSAKLFLMGNVLFSGSLMVMTLTDLRILGAITPIGGVLYLIGWGWIVRSFIKSEEPPTN